MKKALLFLMFLSIFAVYGQDCPEIRNRKAERLVKSAADEMRSRRYLQANNLLKEAIALEPEYAEAYYMLAMINIQRRDYNVRAAENYLLKTLEICPDYDVYAHYYLGDIYLGARKYPEAVRHFRAFLRDVEKIRTDRDYTKLLPSTRPQNSTQRCITILCHSVRDR